MVSDMFIGILQVSSAHTETLPQKISQGQKIANRRNVKAVYVSVERDAARMNHMHLAIATSKKDLKKNCISMN